MDFLWHALLHQVLHSQKGIPVDNSLADIVCTHWLVPSLTFLSLVIFRVDWKSKAELHKRAAEAYSHIKLECQELLMTFNTASDTEIQKLLIRYRDLGEICVAVPEGSFLRLKNKHKLKVALSKYLDDNPGACLLLLKLKIWFVDTFKPSSPNLLKKYLESTTNTEEEL